MIFHWKKPALPGCHDVRNHCDYCWVCGHSAFLSSNVLWQELIDDWAIQPDEVDYINRQQGTVCTSCNNNLRSIAIAKAILSKYNFPGTLQQFFKSKKGSKLSILSINTAGGLTQTLELLPSYQLAEYPAHDMLCLTFKTGSFDLVIHSDTLEHIPNPILGLQECKRVIAAGGSCIYTIPMIVGRLSTGRANKKISYHGNADTASGDWAVQTEYGADAWRDCFHAGFSSVRLHCLEYPAALAFECIK